MHFISASFDCRIMLLMSKNTMINFLMPNHFAEVKDIQSHSFGPLNMRQKINATLTFHCYWLFVSFELTVGLLFTVKCESLAHFAIASSILISYSIDSFVSIQSHLETFISTSLGITVTVYLYPSDSIS